MPGSDNYDKLFQVTLKKYYLFMIFRLLAYTTVIGPHSICILLLMVY